MAASMIKDLSAKNEKLREHVQNVAAIRCGNCNEKIPIVPCKDIMMVVICKCNSYIEVDMNTLKREGFANTEEAQFHKITRLNHGRSIDLTSWS